MRSCPRCRAIKAEELDLQRSGHRERYFILHRKNIGNLAVIGVRPELKPVARSSQIHSNAEVVALAAHASLQDAGDGELPSYRAQVLVPALELKGRRPGHYPHVRNLGEIIDQFFSESVGEILLIFVPAQIDKRQYGDGGGAPCGSMSVAFSRPPEVATGGCQ